MEWDQCYLLDLAVYCTVYKLKLLFTTRNLAKVYDMIEWDGVVSDAIFVRIVDIVVADDVSASPRSIEASQQVAA